MKGLRNKVILSGIVLMFAFIATIGSTYAWFTVSTEATVEGVNLQVAASQNLKIVPSDYDTPSNDHLTNLRSPEYYPTSLINLASLQAKGYLPSGESAWRLKPSTIWGGGSDADTITLNYISNMEAVMAGNGTTPTPSYLPATENSAGGYYIQIKFWLLSQASEDQDLFLNDLTIESADGNSTAQSEIANSVRVAFTFDDSTITIPVEEAYVPDGPSSTVIYGHDADSLYTITTAGTPITLGALPPAPSISAPVLGPTSSLYVLHNNIPTLVTMDIFVEGWDADADNNVIMAAFNIAFGFTIANVPTP